MIDNNIRTHGVRKNKSKNSIELCLEELNQRIYKLKVDLVEKILFQ